MPNCEICGEPMPEGEEMFKFHGYSGPCPKPPLPRAPTAAEEIDAERKNAAQEFEAYAGKDKERRAYLHGVAIGLQKAWAVWKKRKPVELVGS